MLTIRSLIVLAALVLAPVAAVSLDGTGSLSGAARVIDGDTLEISGQKLRLFGIDAPELHQDCDRANGTWSCGKWSRKVLQTLVQKNRVACRAVDRDRYGRIVGICEVQGTDLGAAMVRAGAAIAFRHYSDRYVSAEKDARAGAIGIWAGRMVTPSTFRQQAHPGTPLESAGNCSIKGNVGSSGKIYHMPGQRDYAATRISPAKGEAWFCSEAEARAAGFRPARR